MDYICECKKTVSIKAVIKREGKILMVKNTHGVYDLPGGRMRCGESIRDALFREVQEEIGKDISSVAAAPTLAFSWEYKEGKSHGIVIAYEVEVVEGDHKADDADIIGIEWIEPSQIADLHMPPAWKDAYLQAFAK
jgi:8-oxo-dGTP diphosphatase